MAKDLSNGVSVANPQTRAGMSGGYHASRVSADQPTGSCAPKGPAAYPPNADQLPKRG